MSMAARAIVEGFRIGCLNAAKEIEKQMKKEKKKRKQTCWKKRGRKKKKGLRGNNEDEGR